MNRTKLPQWLAMALLLPALFSLYSIYKRNQAESLNRATAFATEYETIEALAAAQGMPIDSAIEEMKGQGLNAVVLSEESVAELIGRGRLTLGAQSFTVGGKTANEYGLYFSDPHDMARVQRALRTRFHDLAGPMNSSRPLMLSLPPVAPALVRATSVGLSPDQTEIARRHGLQIIARFSNPPGVSSATVRDMLTWAHEMGATVFLPSGDQVLGRRNALGTTQETLQTLGMLYATPEFTRIGGDDELVKKAPENVVRLHSAQVAELDRLSPADAVERYVKAARERNMRVLLIRPLSFGAEHPLSDFGDFIGSIRKEVEKEGGALGKPKPFEPPTLPRWFPILIGLSIVPAGFFVGSAFFSDRRLQAIGLGLLVLLGAATAVHTGLQIMALVATLVFPVAAFLVLDALRPRNVLLGFLLVSAISLIGGLCVAGMMNGLPYYIKADEFSGVKISIFLPIVIIGFLFLQRLADLKSVLKAPITWSTVALGVTIAAVLGLMIARTGNDTGAGPSGGEMVFRNLLDRFLFVRPRTKEFLIGHPLLIAGIGLLSYLTRHPNKVATWGGWAALLLMVGSMGQTSIVNTLTHLHIPVYLSLARIALGVVLGCIIGLGLWAIVSRLLPRDQEEA
ncbi:DUF5693 family protein [Fimbriimonas ginsengisoli]|uniref:Uncharacterized protein n=1 Tax=Fimbriimonas ginsengisoli Gsoil 348 TaxID=661478 RepID=A0A068NNS9_FIMGI|nr:DUF5693 family protein [Fimbriimonas ginsengisoli]AIE85037.1 hypothetical protein OP10G_1669 [Fimbriimonas ginsengisoli Gsoil 348]